MSHLGTVPRPYEINKARTGSVSSHERHVDNLDDDWSASWNPKRGRLEIVLDCGKCFSTAPQKEVLNGTAELACQKCRAADAARLQRAGSSPSAIAHTLGYPDGRAATQAITNWRRNRKKQTT